MDITRFCAVRDSREWMKKPFRFGRHIYATNGHIAVRIHDAPAIDSGKSEKAEVVVSLFEKTIASDLDWLVIPDLGRTKACWICGGTGYAKPCPECDGDGEFDRGNHTYECQECNATGEVAWTSGSHCSECCGTGINSYDGMDVGRAHYAKRYLRLIAEQFPGAEIGAPSDELATAMWRAGDVIGLLMPMRRGV